FGWPRGGFVNLDKAVLDNRSLCVQTQGLVAVRVVAGDTVAAIMDQLLDQLGPGGLVLDQHLARTEQPLLLAHGALQRWVLEPPAEHAEEEEVLATHPPSCAHREIAE